MGNRIQHPVKNRYSPYRDDIILDCFHRGILTGTSLMVFSIFENRHFQVNGKSAASAVKKGQEAGICIGLHFNISEGIPISEPSKIPSLLHEVDGVVQFLGKEGFIHAVTEGYIVPGEVEIELRNQVCISLFVLLRFKSSSS